MLGHSIIISAAIVTITIVHNHKKILYYFEFQGCSNDVDNLLPNHNVK
jgi:hypothetical protein